MISLFPFQITAAKQLGDRYRDFISDPDRPSRRNFGPLPFYQTLRALTGAGKTPILADAVEQMRTSSAVEPIILWISKGKVVVDQTYANLADGGKYSHLIPQFLPTYLRDATPDQITDGNQALILLGTVATFNSKERGDRKIFAVQTDVGGMSLWDSMIQRTTVDGFKRPLIVVYDEGHNLTEQQGELLLELAPDGIVVASATPRLSRNILELVEALKVYGYTDDELTTGVKSVDVVDAELVKKEVLLGGYVTAEEVAIAAMLEDHRAVESAAKAQGLSLQPKCIYVCKTNVTGDAARPFAARNAPPIKIWRYLVEQEKIDPLKIAVYCDLHVNASNPLPEEFILFKGGDKDYDVFVEGDFQHIIFNLSLQEGWDDPECYLAYVDKSMQSELQIEQIVGRVLRQPNAQYYADARLNSCSFYIHLDEAGVFREILERVQERISSEIPGVGVRSTGGSNRRLLYHQPLKEMPLPAIQLNTAVASEEVAALLDDIEDYQSRSDAESTGKVTTVAQSIGAKSGTSTLEWSEHGHGMPVSVEWLLTREIERRYPAASSVCDFEEPRFKRRIHLGSRAARNLENHADRIVTTFLENVTISTRASKHKFFGSIPYDREEDHEFQNSLHPTYSDLKPNELKCAKALDKLGWTWCRNPSASGFFLPLPDHHGSRSFYPDFIVWTDNAIWLVDPKGEHLIQRDAGKKLIAIENETGSNVPNLKVCLITEGKWNRNYEELPSPVGTLTSWVLRGGRPAPTAFEDIDKLLERVIGRNTEHLPQS